MSKTLQVALEIGPKGKKAVAIARDWPGLSRGAATEERAMESLRLYVPRYSRVAERAGLTFDDDDAEVVERYSGTGSTDFWGISFGFSTFDRQPLTTSEIERELSLMQACWAEFDEVRERVSAEMRKGPRGGGRDRDRIARHTIATEHGWGRKLGLDATAELPLAGSALLFRRESYCDAIRMHHREGGTARNWPLRFLIRHTAFHTMDHAWEMEDKDLAQT